MQDKDKTRSDWLSDKFQMVVWRTNLSLPVKHECTARQGCAPIKSSANRNREFSSRSTGTREEEKEEKTTGLRCSHYVNTLHYWPHLGLQSITDELELQLHISAAVGFSQCKGKKWGSGRAKEPIQPYRPCLQRLLAPLVIASTCTSPGMAPLFEKAIVHLPRTGLEPFTRPCLALQ